MLIMSVAISRYRLIAGSSLFTDAFGRCRGLWHRPLWQWQETKRCLRRQQIYITLFSSSPSFHFSISSYPGLVTLMATSFLYDWEIYNPIRTAPCLWLGPLHIHKQKIYKSKNSQTGVCAIAYQADEFFFFCFFFVALCTYHPMWKCCTWGIALQREEMATYLQFFGLFQELNRMLHLLCTLRLPA